MKESTPAPSADRAKLHLTLAARVQYCGTSQVALLRSAGAGHRHCAAGGPRRVTDASRSRAVRGDQHLSPRLGALLPDRRWQQHPEEGHRTIPALSVLLRNSNNDDDK